MDTKSIIYTKNLSKIYQMGDFDVIALNQVELKVSEGEYVAIMGPSGSGKSTMMNIIGCLDKPTEGEYFLGEEDVSKLNKLDLADIRNKKIGFVFQTFNLLARMTALENVALPLHYDRKILRTDEEINAIAIETLESVGLGDRLNHIPPELSGGQRQRVAIARALVNDPLILLADEPTGNLDSKSGEEIMAILDELHSRGRTIVMVTHEKEIAEHATRIIHFLDGEIVVDKLKGHSKKEKTEKVL